MIVVVTSFDIRLFAGRLDLILWTDEATGDTEAALGVDADERAGPRHLGGIVDHRPIVERLQRRLDLTETPIDALGQLVGLAIVSLELGLLGSQRFNNCLLVSGEFGGLSVQLAKAMRMSEREIDGGRDPFPALRANPLSLRLELFRDEPVEQRDILQPAAIVGLEQIPQHGPARRLVGVDPDELNPSVEHPHRLLNELPADLVGRIPTGAADLLPDLLLACMIRRHRKRHQLLERHAFGRIYIEQHGRDRGQT